MDLSKVAEQMLSVAKAEGAMSADVLVVDGTSVTIDVRNGRLEQAERSEGVDIGLRVIQGNKQAVVSASDTSGEVMRQMAQRCVAMANEAPIDTYCALAHSSEFATDWDVESLELYDPASPVRVDEMQEDAQQAEATACLVSGVSQVQSASAGYNEVDFLLANSNGFLGGYKRSSYGVSCVAISTGAGGMERDYCYEKRIYKSDMPNPVDIGRLAGERTVSRIGARQPPTGYYPVIFDERVSATLIGHLLSAINGAAIVQGVSWLKNTLGEQILPQSLSLIENPFRRRISQSRPFDSEGLPSVKRAVISNGVLTDWIMDLSTARQLGRYSTANATRSVSAPPSPSVGNLTLTQGRQSVEQMAKDIGHGLLITSLIGSTINPNTGDYSRGAAGYWIENGMISYPVNECTVAGNLREMLGTLIPANDARQYVSRVIPSLLVEGLTIAGK